MGVGGGHSAANAFAGARDEDISAREVGLGGIDEGVCVVVNGGHKRLDGLHVSHIELLEVLEQREKSWLDIYVFLGLGLCTRSWLVRR